MKKCTIGLFSKIITFLVFAVYRTFYLGLIWVEYDMENVIFHYSRKEEYRIRWEEIPGNQMQIERAADMFSVSTRMGDREKSP